MSAAPRVLSVVIALLLAAAVLAPVSGASPRRSAAIGAPDGLRAEHPAASRKARAAQLTAADPRADEQWALQGDGPMGAASAWRQTTGGDVTVAVIDSGVDLTHPDLVPNLWTNPGEIPGNGIDDDGNGYVDDVHGYDFVDNTGNPQDANGHGTHVAGIVAARGGNGIGVAGVAWSARIMAIRVLDASARGTTTTVAQGIRYAVDNGARIINLSLAGPSPARDLEDAIVYAQQHGVLIVVAAGNEGRDLAAAPTYPAAYPEDNILGVAATTQDGVLAGVSDFGVGADLAAPGADILSTALGGGYEWRTGTSMAAPQVAGALVLLAAARPDLDARGLRDALLAGTRKQGLAVESGALDAGAALHGVIPAANWQPVATKAAVAPAARSTAAAPQAAKPRKTVKATGRTASRRAAARAKQAKKAKQAKRAKQATKAKRAKQVKHAKRAAARG
jgi:subtilisin family serine protease